LPAKDWLKNVRENNGLEGFIPRLEKIEKRK
jgi:hypothetical protein